MYTSGSGPRSLSIQKRRRYLQSEEELPGSSSSRRIYRAYDSEEGVEVILHIVPYSPAGSSSEAALTAIESGTTTGATSSSPRVSLGGSTKDDHAAADSTSSLSSSDDALSEQIEAKAVAESTGKGYSNPLLPHYNLNLEHEHLIRVLDSWHEDAGAATNGEDDGVDSSRSSDNDSSEPRSYDTDRIVFVTPIVTAGTLSMYIVRMGADDVRLRVVRKWCRQILSGLIFLHETHHRPHGDLRLSNIYINGETGNVLLGNFVVRRGLALSSPIDPNLPCYEAPEVIQALKVAAEATVSGNKEAEASAWAVASNSSFDQDTWAFGICALEMTMKQIPWARIYENPEDVAVLLNEQYGKEGGETTEETSATQSSSSSTNNVAASAGALDTSSTTSTESAFHDLVLKCLSVNPASRPSPRSLLDTHPFFRLEKKDTEASSSSLSIDVGGDKKEKERVARANSSNSVSAVGGSDASASTMATSNNTNDDSNNVVGNSVGQSISTSPVAPSSSSSTS